MMRPRCWTVAGRRVRVLEVTPDTTAGRARLRRRIARSVAAGATSGWGGTLGEAWRWELVR